MNKIIQNQIYYFYSTAMKNKQKMILIKKMKRLLKFLKKMMFFNCEIFMIKIKFRIHSFSIKSSIKLLVSLIQALYLAQMNVLNFFSQKVPQLQKIHVIISLNMEQL